MEIDKSGHSVREMFSAIAGRYDLLNHLLSANQDKRWRRRAIRLLSPRRGECILDLCCGTGDLAIECARRQPHCHIVGADFAVPMLQIAQSKTQNSKFLAADALRLPFADETFDVVMVAFGARNFENTMSGLGEMQRVVRPGGRVLVLEFMRPTSPLLQRGFGLFFQNVLPVVGRMISGHGAAYQYLPSSVADFYTRREFVKLLRQIGLANVRSFDYSGGIATSFSATKPEHSRR
ncbi:MAG TPA: bifunctional demethylmenaquinone methyltransferase/2-methoxy-6-polyprenyl-1,4-benzoquinol methylase UbiE [Abditibacteriaceae bacterium]|nr:bifunctional demethylmenaquinone methyltransferase/2-methoxy-6-polyprenyl-1,4-benzoquinol methylase UbiE [Abditibacteriaceae bacterium]